MGSARCGFLSLTLGAVGAAVPGCRAPWLEKKEVTCQRSHFISLCEEVPSSVTDFLPTPHLTAKNPGEMKEGVFGEREFCIEFFGSARNRKRSSSPVSPRSPHETAIAQLAIIHCVPRSRSL